MKPQVRQQLLALNRAFYDGVSDSFAQSRQQPQPGFEQLAAWLPSVPIHLLDVGCGNGRFGHALWAQQAIVQLMGVDFSAALLDMARANGPGDFVQRDMSQRNCLKGLGQFEVVACLAALHHIPAYGHRLQLVRAMGERLTENGRLFLSTWQFMDSPRQRRKVTPWSQVGLRREDVERNDYLLTWQRGRLAYRYVCLIDAEETAVLAQEAGLRILHQFRSDGKEGNLSLYTILEAAT